MSLINFQPLIDASREASRSSQRRSEMRASAVERGFAQIGAGVEEAARRGQEREKQFESIFDYDLNKNASREARGYLVDKYDRIKKDSINMFMENKNILGYGKLTPEQKIDVQDKMDSFKREAELLNVINQQVGNAEKLSSQRKHAVELDREKIGKYLELLKPKKDGKYDTDGLVKFLSEVDQTPTGQPFTTYRNFDPYLHLDQSRGLLKKEFKPEKVTEEVVVDRGGKRYTSVYEKLNYGTEEERRNSYFAMLSSSKDQDWYEYNIGEKLTEDERETAIAKYGDKVANPMSAYFAYEKADMTKGFEGSKRLVKEKEIPAPMTGKTGEGKGTYIPYDNGTWKLGTTEIPITTEIDGNPVSGKIYEIYTDENGVHKVKMRYKDPLSGFGKTYEGPLEEVYDEVDRAINRYPKGGLKLEGWSDIEFKEVEETPEIELKKPVKTNVFGREKEAPVYKLGEKECEEGELIKLYKENKYPDKSEEEIRDLLRKKFKNNG